MRLELFDADAATEVALFLSGCGFVVRRRDRLLEVHLRDHVSARYDGLKVREALRTWLVRNGCVIVVHEQSPGGHAARVDVAA